MLVFRRELIWWEDGKIGRPSAIIYPLRERRRSSVWSGTSGSPVEKKGIFGAWFGFGSGSGSGSRSEGDKKRGEVKVGVGSFVRWKKWTVGVEYVLNWCQGIRSGCELLFELYFICWWKPGCYGWQWRNLSVAANVLWFVLLWLCVGFDVLHSLALQKRLDGRK